MKTYEFEIMKDDKTIGRDRREFESIEEARLHRHKLMVEQRQGLGADMIHIRENGSEILETYSE